jgi:exopolyphosphatase/guanosine-5'-triphosphate,3'-diphosphate pyrophosphatase
VWRRLEGFLDEVAEPWELKDDHYKRLGRWAAALHEVGLVVSYAGHHRHGAYLIEHSDLAGFSRLDQQMLAGLVLCHRRKFRHEAFNDIAGASERRLKRLAVLLRLAVHVERMRTDTPSPAVSVAVDGRKVAVKVSAQTTEDSLLVADLEGEAERLARGKFEIVVS